jgi:cell division control protein 6
MLHTKEFINVFQNFIVSYLRWDETLFKNPEVFDVDYLPEVILHRETQLNHLAMNLKPAIRGSAPVNTICIGPPATGKTTAVKTILKELSEYCKVAYVNCRNSDTKFQIFSHIYREISGITVQRGLSFHRLYSKLMERLENEVIVVALDDFNYVFDEREVNETLYALLKAHETYDVKVGLICIVTDVKFTHSLDASVGSIFHADEIYFPLYSRGEIEDILRSRAEMGFYEGSLTDEAFEKVVELTHTSSDLRLGLFLLKLSGLEAERRASRKIEIEDVERAYSKGKSLFLDKSLSALKKDERKLLEIIYKSNVETSGDIYEIVRGEMYYEKFNEILRKLENIRLIDLKVEYSRGKRQRILRRFEVDILLDALDRISS